MKPNKLKFHLRTEDFDIVLFFEILQVNVEDINQLLAYHEVFGKLSTDSLVPVQQNGSKVQEGSASVPGGAPGSPTSVGPYSCDICCKIFPFRYQLIVHRRYHTERKPFTCQVKKLGF